MAEDIIDFGASQATGLSELAGSSPVAQNVIVEKSGTVRRRPALVAATGITSGVVDSDGLDGLIVAQNGKVYAASAAVNRTLYQVSETASAIVNGAGGSLRGGQRPVFAETEAILAITAGEAPKKLVFEDNEVTNIEGGPPHCSHIIANKLRLVANDLATRSQIQYSGLASGSSYAGHEEWGLGAGDSGIISAEGRPDPVLALGENTNEVFVFGTTSVQVFAPDPSFVYSPVSTREFGISAPYSVVKRDQEFVWLDQLRRFVASNGRTFEVLSDPIQQSLDDMSSVLDCFGYWVALGPVDAYVWTFPTGGKTFVYSKGGGWSQWSSYGQHGWGQFPVTSFAFNPGNKENLVGTGDGRVLKLKMGESSDFGDLPIVAYTETGFLNRKTEKRKHCRAVRLSLRRGLGATEEPVAFISYRDEPGEPLSRIPVELGLSGDTAQVVVLRSLGVYRKRQWVFEFSADVELELVSAIEEFDVLVD
jgi:hypothetical protein